VDLALFASAVGYFVVAEVLNPIASINSATPRDNNTVLALMITNITVDIGLFIVDNDDLNEIYCTSMSLSTLLHSRQFHATVALS
jgi:hypothetical protein